MKHTTRKGKLSHLFSWIQPQLPLIVVIIVVDSLLKLKVYNKVYSGNLYLFSILAVILYIAFRHGRKTALISTTIAFLYVLYYATELSSLLHEPFSLAIPGIITVFILFYSLALLVGWLRDKIVSSFEREQEARKLAEEERNRLRAVLQQMPAGVIIAQAPRGKIIIANEQAEQIMGLSFNHVQSVKDYSSRGSFNGNGKKLTQQKLPMVQALKEGKVLKNQIIEYKRPDGEQLFLSVNAAPILNTENKISHAVVAFYDVTGQQEIERRKDDFISMASHELKTPLTSMKVYVEILRKRLLSLPDHAEASQLVGKIEDQTLKLTKLVSELLDMSRITTGKLEYRLEWFDLNNLAAEIVEALQQTTKLRLTIKGRIPGQIKADRYRIYQVLTNLINNAIKYSPGTKKVIIHLELRSDQIVVGVQDFGIGIAPENQRRIFERLYQVNDPEEKTFPGLGIGLYISSEIIKRHHGKIWVESQKGRGSTFFFSLPRRKTTYKIETPA